MDYLACARPVVGTDIGAIGTLLREGEAGVTVPPTSEGLARGILKLISSPNQRQRQGTNALKLAQNKFDWNKNSKSIYEIIERYVPHK
jgi:glycosyltransferase involved in cell wall biosynthesis